MVKPGISQCIPTAEQQADFMARLAAVNALLAFWGSPASSGLSVAETPNPVEPVLSGKPISPCISWVLETSLELARYNGGSLKAAVVETLNAVSLVNKMTIAGAVDQPT